MNRVILIGRTTKDIELRYTNNEKAVARFTIAVNRKVQDGADFINCVAWGKTAELLDKYVKKGHRVGIIGRIQTGSYDKDGKKVYTTDVVAEEVEFLEASGEKKTEVKQTETGFVEDEGLPFNAPF